MNVATDEVSRKTRYLILYQLAAGAIVAVLFLLFKDLVAAVSALAGALTSSASAFLLGTGVSKAEASAIDNPGKSVGTLYFGAVKRFLLVIILFVLGLKFLHLDALAMAAGFIAAQIGFVFLFKGLSKVG
ncbi:MAG: ATP synthase subunit I [Gammaproteobacteria bacterium]|nr:ATP synthase subunit I [Gammaproteobacteria bacterium]